MHTPITYGIEESLATCHDLVSHNRQNSSLSIRNVRKKVTWVESVARIYELISALKSRSISPCVMHPILEGRPQQERASSVTELPTFLQDLTILDGDDVPQAGLLRSISARLTEGEQEKKRSKWIRRACFLRFSPVISTEQCNRDDTAPFRGPYAHLRKDLDYTYHARYRKERQWLQDSIIEVIMEAHCPDDFDACVIPKEPWLIFTVGSRGAGKKHVLTQLASDDRMPLLSYVRVDPDEIRRRLPEFDTYSNKSPCLVDELTRKESGFIAELLLLAALQNGRNTVMDGSMSDPSYHLSLIGKLRQRYPCLKIGIIHITAPGKTLLIRARAKFKDTGREVTQDFVDSYTQKIKKSVEVVRSHVHFCCNIHNGNGPLKLGDMDWEDFRKNFIQTCAWKPGMVGKQKIPDQLTDRDPAMDASRHRSIQGARQKHRRFSVLISSEENNQSDDLNFYGKFSHIRETLDYQYHSNYTFERQKLQDAIVDDMLDAAIFLDVDGKIGSVPTEPWIVFTAGPMGAGKSHVMKTLLDKALFPLKAFVMVDPDEIRHLLPEYHVYIDENPEIAGEMTRKEAGFIAEILTLAALQAGKNVLQDGSLRDWEWYKEYFARLRDEFPAVRQAILHVTAPRETVFRRAAERGIETGRWVPHRVLEAALEQVPRSVEILSPLVDYYAELNNDNDVELVNPPRSTWEQFRDVWIQ